MSRDDFWLRQRGFERTGDFRLQQKGEWGWIDGMFKPHKALEDIIEGSDDYGENRKRWILRRVEPQVPLMLPLSQVQMITDALKLDEEDDRFFPDVRQGRRATRLSIEAQLASNGVETQPEYLRAIL